MSNLTGAERKRLRGKAHNLKPMVLIGHEKLSEGILNNIKQALIDHELIKIKINIKQDKKDKQQMIEDIEMETQSECVGTIGHVIILYKKID